MWWQVVAMCDLLDDGGQAYKVAEAWKNGPVPKTDASRHMARVAMVHAAVARGDGKLAAQMARDAGNAATVNKNVQRQPIDQGVLARNIESAIGQKEYDQAVNLIMDWENDYPESIVDGFTRLLRVKLEDEGFEVFQHRNVSPGDGGLSYGQVAVAAAMLRHSPAVFSSDHSPLIFKPLPGLICLLQ